MKREEKRERIIIGYNGKEYKTGIIMKYSRRDKIGEGFGKRKVGDRILVVVKYINKEIKEKVGENVYKWKVMDRKEKEEGVIIRIVRRINNGYYDYWYKVRLDNKKEIWRSYVELIKCEKCNKEVKEELVLIMEKDGLELFVCKKCNNKRIMEYKK